MSQYNVGIVGDGWAATAHIPAINGGTLGRVAAVCSSRKLDAAELSAKHGSSIRTFTDYGAMLRDPGIDVVSICSYHRQHAEQAVAAARAGKHVIVEKPLALSLKDVRAVEKAVRDAGVRFCICFELRFSAQFRAIKSLIDAGMLGRLHYGEIDYYHGIGPWYREYEWCATVEDCGSSLLEAGCHALDALLLCMGPGVEEVFSYGTKSSSPTFAAYAYPSTTVTVLKFADGRAGKVASVIDCWQPYYFHTHLVGSEGSLLDNRIHSNRLGGLDWHAWSQLSYKPVDSGDVSDHPYRTQFDAFFESIGAGKDMPLTGLADAVRTHEVLFAADRSWKERRPVRLDEMK